MLLVDYWKRPVTPPETSTKSGAFPQSPGDVNDMMQSVDEHDMGMPDQGPSDSLQQARAFGDASGIAASSSSIPTTGGNVGGVGGAGGAAGGGGSDKYGQDAIEARIAALNEKLDLNSSKLDNVELPKGIEPEPSVLSDSGAPRRDAVNRILEEANAHNQGQPSMQDSGSSSMSGVQSAPPPMDVPETWILEREP